MTSPRAIVSGRYQLNRKLDDVNQATIWDAYDTALQRRVLVRLLRADLSDDEAAVERFRGDVRAAALSASPDRPRVLDAGNDPETHAPFVVLEWRQESSGDPARPGAALEATAQIPTLSEPGRGAAPRGAPRLPKASPRGRGRGRGIRAAEVLVIGMLLVVPLGLGALAISNWLSQPSAVAPGLFTLPAAPDLGKPSGGAAPAAAATSAPVAGKPPPAGAEKPAAPPTLAPPARPTAGPTPTQALSGERRRVANTDGLGVALRGTAGGDRLPGRGYDEGAVVTLLEQDGAWARIRGDDGREGWVLAVTLVQ